MKLFSCQSCGQVLYFESVQCTRCGHALAYLPDRTTIGALESAADPNAAVAGATPIWRVAGDQSGATYRLCRNQTEHAVCNWAIPASDPSEYCASCRLNHLIPNLERSGAKDAWHRLEIAKRRVLYSLYALGLPVEARSERANGLQFDFLQDLGASNQPRVFTGHSDGLITINVAEADDPFREKMRVQMGEAYRTVLGHFRHEIGHYYWDRLIDDGPRLAAFRERFGDERADYVAAQQRHYADGAPADWPTRFVSAYASMHPWEDWAETWAHYLHITDTLETAHAYDLSLHTRAPASTTPPPKSPVAVAPDAGPSALASGRLDPHSFQQLIDGWIPLTTALNSLNRSMGAADGYPFVLPALAIEKLRFVHDTIEGWSAVRRTVPPAAATTAAVVPPTAAAGGAGATAG